MLAVSYMMWCWLYVSECEYEAVGRMMRDYVKDWQTLLRGSFNANPVIEIQG